MFKTVLTGKKVPLGLRGINRVKQKYAEKKTTTTTAKKTNNDVNAVKQEVKIERLSAPPRKT